MLEGVKNGRIPRYKHQYDHVVYNNDDDVIKIVLLKKQQMLKVM